MKPVLITAATLLAFTMAAVAPASAGTLSTMPDDMVFPTDFDGFVADKAKKTVKADK